MINSLQTYILYFIICVFSLFTFYKALKCKKNNEKVNNKKFYLFTILSAFPLWFLNVFRSSNVGEDYVNVGNAYSNIVNGNDLSRNDWFGKPLEILCEVVGRIFGSAPFWFYLILGTLTIYFLYKFLLSNCKYPTFSLGLYFVFCLYLQTFNQSRQMLALIIIMYAIKYIKENKLLKYIVFILIASVFHSTALVFLPLYLFKNINIDKRTFILYLILLLFVIFDNYLINAIIRMTKYSIYFSTEYNVSSVTSTILATIVRFAMLLFCLKYRDKSKSDDKLYNFSLHMIIICIIINVFAIKYYFVARLVTYFYAFFMITLPISINEFLSKMNFKHKQVFFIIIVLGLVVYYSTYYFSGTGAVGSGYDNYEFIFNNKHEVYFK